MLFYNLKYSLFFLLIVAVDVIVFEFNIKTSCGNPFAMYCNKLRLHFNKHKIVRYALLFNNLIEKIIIYYPIK